MTTKEKHWETVGGSVVPAIDRIEFDMIAPFKESNKNLAAPAGRLLNSRQYRTMSYIPDEGRSKRRSSKLLRWLIYLIDPVVDNLLKCFTFPPTQHTVSFETKSPIVGPCPTTTAADLHTAHLKSSPPNQSHILTDRMLNANI